MEVCRLGIAPQCAEQIDDGMFGGFDVDLRYLNVPPEQQPAAPERKRWDCRQGCRRGCGDSSCQLSGVGDGQARKGQGGNQQAEIA